MQPAPVAAPSAPRDTAQIAPELPSGVTAASDALALASPVLEATRADLAQAFVARQTKQGTAMDIRPAPSRVAAETAPAAPQLARTQATQMAEAQTTEDPVAAQAQTERTTRRLEAEPDPPEQSAQTVAVSPRPAARPKRPAPPKQQPTKTPQTQQTVKAPSVQPGNANRNARAGAVTGNQQAQSNRQTTRARQSSAESGNAAASNYPGQVMHKISRARRPRASAKSWAVVRFSVDASGGLGSVGIAKSSGSAKFDQAALSVVRRAAPFPAPPPGALRKFTIRIEPRG